MQLPSLVSFFVGLALVLVAAAPAQGQSAEEQALARELFEEGVARSQERRWNEAVDAFARSYAIAERAPTLFNLASALTQAGRLVEARERYRSYLRSGEDEGLRTEAQRAIDALEPRLARVRLTIDNLQPVDVVHLDEGTLNHAALGAAIPADPGAHRISVSRGDTVLVAQQITVDEGESQDVALTVPIVDDVEVGHGLPGPDAPTEPEDDDSGGVLSSPWFWITMGLLLVGGGVALAVVLVTESERLPLYDGGTTDPPSIGLP